MRNVYLRSTIIFSLLIILCSYNVSYAIENIQHWASKEVNDFIDNGYVSGDFKDQLDNPVSKGEIAVIANMYYSYSDLTSKEEALKIAKEKGYLKNANVLDNVTREEACAIFTVLTNTALSNGNIAFKDVGDISSWAIPYVSAMAEKKIVVGYPDEMFRPQSLLTKAEFITMLSRIEGVGGADDFELIDEEINDIEVGIIDYSGDVAEIVKINDEITLNSGDKMMISIAIPEGVRDDEIIAEVEDETIATFDEEFSLITAVSKGTTNITFKTKDNEYLKNIKIIIK